MIDNIFYFENENYKIFQRTHLSKVNLYNKMTKIIQYIEPAFFVEILKAPLSDVDVLLSFPWRMDMLRKGLSVDYLEDYYNFWNNSLAGANIDS